MGNSLRQFYEFGPFRLDPQKHRLLRDGEVVSLSPKALEALLVLVRNPGKLLERETLMQAVWADTFVEDANLTVAISHLRKALGQNGETAEYVETVPRIGYRFVPDVREVREESAPLIIEKRTLSRTVIEEEEVEPDSPQAVAGALPSSRELHFDQPKGLARRTWALAIAAIGLVAVVGAGFFWTFHETSRAGTSAAQVKSIAVLPLKSFKQNQDEELRLRITDALITKLGNLNGISVRPTNSILGFAKEETDAIEAGRKLEVDAVLDGRIQTEGERLRVTLQLVSVHTGENIWSGQFDGKTDEILSLQDRISAQLLPRLAQPASLAKNATINAEAYEDYLKGRYLWNQRTPSETKRAVEYFEQAIALDPNFALAYAGLADAYSMLTNGGRLPPVEGYAKAKEMAQKALTIDPNLSEAYSALGWILFKGEWNWAEAETAFARAIDLNPNNAEAHHWRALNFLALGKNEEYFAEMEKARQLAPLIKPISENYYRVVLKTKGCEKAFEYLEKFHALYQSSETARAELSGYHYANCGDYNQTIAIMEKLPIEKLPGKAQAILAVAYAKTGRRQGALEILKRLKQTDSSMKFYLMSYIHVALSDFDAAFADLEKGVTARDDRFVKLTYDDFLAPLRSDPRFKQILHRMNLA